jgi:hypothetical protein
MLDLHGICGDLSFEIFFVWGMLSFREVHLDVDQSTTRTLGTNSEDTTSGYGKMRAMFVKALVHHHPNTQLLNADASISPELLSGLKVSGHTNNFLWLWKSLLLTLIFTMSVSFMFLLLMSLLKLHHGATRERWKVGKDDFQILNTGKGAGREDGGVVDTSQQLELVLKLPKNITELREVRETLLIYQKEHQQQVELLSVCLQLYHCSTLVSGSGCYQESVIRVQIIYHATSGFSCFILCSEKGLFFVCGDVRFRLT